MTLIVQIVSAASTDQRYFVNIGGGQAQADQSIIVWGWSNIQWNDCWELTPQGMIVCAVDPQLVIGVDGDNNVITVTRDESDSSQCWTIARLPNSAACTIQNKSSLLYLTVPDSIQGGVQLATQASGSGVPEGQDWIIAPAPLPMSRQYYVRTLLDDSIESGTPYVMTASGSSAGSTVAVDTWQPCASSQLWTFNSDGTISSAVGSSLVLTASRATGGDNSTTIETAVPDNPLQVWTVNDNGTITVQVAAQNPTTQCLNVSGVITIPVNPSSPLKCNRDRRTMSSGS